MGEVRAMEQQATNHIEPHQTSLEVFCKPVKVSPEVKTEVPAPAKRTHDFHVMQETSMESYLDLKNSGELGERKQQVLEAFRKFGNSTNLEISMLTKLPINVVTARTNELVNQYVLLIPF